MLRDGAFKDIDIFTTICSLIKGGSSGDTTFSELSASGNIRNGVLDSRDLDVRSPALRIGGAGTIDLTRSYIDYLTTVRLVDTCSGQGGLARVDLSGIDIPVSIKGPLDKAKPQPDIRAVTAQLTEKDISDRCVLIPSSSKRRIRCG